MALSFEGPAETLTTFVMPGPVEGSLRSVELRDAEGPVEHTVGSDDAGSVTLKISQPVTPPVSIAYELLPAPARPGTTSRLMLADGTMFATGEALLLLPEAALGSRQALRVRIDPAGLEAERGPDDEATATPLRALSTLADAEEFDGHGLPYELRRAAYVAGRFELASFDARGGHDRIAAVGAPSYDSRWIAAEIAGLRTEVDHYFQQSFAGRYITLLAAGPRIPAVPPHVAELRGRGLVVTADVAVSWDAQARLAVATTLVQRWIGGRVRMLESKDAEPSAAWALWFHGGVSRFVARELLFELGLLDPDEYREELDAIELELATSPLREQSLTELVARVDDADPRVALDARALLVARGAFYATWLDARMRAGSADDLGGLLAMVMAVAVIDGHTTITLSTWLGYLRDWVLGDARADFERVVVRGERPRLDAGALGPCFTPKPTTLRRFELGLVDASTPEATRVIMIDPDGPAARAGLRPSDEITGLVHVEGDATAEVEVTIVREGATRVISYLPAGPPRRGIQWRRVARVPDEQCVRR